MTRKDMITACIEDQINRGIVNPNNKKMQIDARLNGRFQMSWSECKRWYDAVFGGEE